MIMSPEYRRNLLDIALVLALLTFVVLLVCAVSITTDIRALRNTQVQEAALIRTGLFKRADDLNTTAEQYLKDWELFIKRFDSQLTQVRSEVKETSDDTRKQTAAAIKQTTAVAQKTIEQTDKVIDAVTQDKPAPVVHVEPSRPADAPIIITPMPLPPPPPPESGRPAEAPQKSTGFGRWLKRVFTFGKG